MPGRPSCREVADATSVRPGKAPKLSPELAKSDPFPDEDEAKKSLADDVVEIDRLQELLFAEGQRSLLVVLQGMDTAGKDGAIKGVFGVCGPLGVEATSFGRPSDEELAHDYLWRVHKRLPKRGWIGVFNRSHYEDVLAVKVRKLAPDKVIEPRYRQINEFERHLIENNIGVLKCMLHISKDEQKKRLQDRLDDPGKNWKFNPGDLDDRKLWPDYMDAYETMLARCSTDAAPWHVIPSDRKWRRNAIVARLVRGALEAMDPKPRKPGFDLKSIKIV
jgi:PPK2 family polyphosphate:nucleotide phosphotransferase